MTTNDTYVNLIGNGESVLAMFQSSTAAAERFGARMTELTGQVSGSSVEMGTVVDDAGVRMDAAFTATTASADRVSTAMAEVTTSVERSATGVDAAATNVSTALDRVGVSADTTATQTDTATRSMSIAMARVGASADAMEAQSALAMDAMRAKTIALSTQLTRTAAEATAANARVGESMVATDARTGLFGANMAKHYAMAGAAMAVVGGLVIDVAAKFQQATTRLVTSGGEIQSNLKADQQGILDLAGQVGYSADALAKAAYTITSAGFQASDMLKILKASAQGAAAEGADLGTVANGLTDILVDYHLKASDAAKVTSQLVETTSQGKTSFQDLAGSLSTVVPLAATAGIKIQDLLAVIAQMTSHGVSASEATQQIANAIRGLESPAQTTTKELGQLGLNATTLSQQLGQKGLAGTFQEIEVAVLQHMGKSGQVLLSTFNTSQIAAQKASTALSGLGKQAQTLADEYIAGKLPGGIKAWDKALSSLDTPQANLLRQWKRLEDQSRGFSDALKTGNGDAQTFTQALQKATGTSSALQVALLTTGENTAATNAKIKAIAGATTEAGNNVKGWSDIQGTFNQKLNEAKDGFGAMAIAVGEKLLPPLTQVAGWFASMFQWLASHQTVATVVAAGIGVLAGALTVAAVATWAMNSALLASPITWITAGVLALAVGVVELIQHWAPIAGFFEGVWRAVSSAFSTAFHAVVGFLKEWGPAILAVIAPFIGIPLLIMQHWGAISKWFEGLWSDVSSVVSSGIGAVVGFFEGIPGDIGRALSAVGSAVSRGFESTMDFFRNLPRNLGFALGYAAGEVVKGAIAIGRGLVTGVTTGAKAVVDFFTALPGRIHSFLASAGTWLVAEGRAIIAGVVNGITTAYQGVIAWFQALPGRLSAFFASAGAWLVSAGTAIVTGVVNGITTGYHSVVSWFEALPGRLASFFGSALSWLHGGGTNIIRGVGNGITSAFWDVVSWFQQLPGRIAGFFSNAGSWLWQAGQDIVSGLIHGIESMFSAVWNSIKNFAGGLVGGFKSALGISSPSRVMADEVGQWITHGIAQGMVSGISTIHTAASTVASAVTGGDYGQGTAGLSAAGISSLAVAGGSPSGLATAPSAVSGQAVMVINLNVQGSVLTDKDLAAKIQTVMTQYGQRNSQTYRSFKR